MWQFASMVSHTASTASHPPRYELLTLGDELLLGLTVNRHLTFIGEQLGRRGMALARNATLPDELEAIAAEFRASWNRSAVVIVTGGLGPTSDDRTREAVAAALGQKLVLDPAVESSIRARFAAFGRKMTDNNLQQAMVFERGDVLPNARGTAPGLWVAQEGKIVVLLPGPPHELEPMFIEQVLPRLERLGLLGPRKAYLQLRTAGIGESALETKLLPLLEEVGPGLGVAYCAHHGQVDVRLSSPDGCIDQARLARLAEACAQTLGADFMCHGHDPLPKICADLLRAQEKKLALAEGATGGLLASAFTELNGACKVIAGGVVCYSNDAKTELIGVPECLLLQHGAASEEAAMAMATAVAEKLGADYALAVTGFARPTGTPNPFQGAIENPLGTIFLALHAPHGAWSKRICYPGPRGIAMKRRVVSAALDWLRRELVNAAQAKAPQRALA